MNRAGIVVENVSPAELYDVISAAASQDPARIQVSTKRLKQMLELSGTYDALHEIAAQKTVPLPVRQQSIIQFKNVALNHWRSRKMLTDEQRARIRARSLMFVDEEDVLIAECNEMIIAKIARQDFPGGWPSLVNDIVGLIDNGLQVRYGSLNSNSGGTLILRRSLKILNEILKEFSSMKMLHGVKTMGQMVEQLHLVLFGYYSKISSSFTSTLKLSTVGLLQTADDILLAHLVYKSLVKMAIWLWGRTAEKASRDGLERIQPWFHDFFQSSVLQAKALIELRTNLVMSLSSSPAAGDAVVRCSVDQLTRHVRLFGKFFRRLQQLSVPRFVALPMCNDMVLYYWSNVVQATDGPPELIADSSTAIFPVRFLVQAMVLFKENLAQWTPQRRDGTPNETSLSQEFVENAVRLLVTRFIPLKPSDLEGWMSDPEEWVNLEERENELWEFELRPCSERVLMTLSQQYKQFVTPLLETTFKQVVAQPTIDLPSIIQKEALYCAIGRCATHLKDIIPFEEWLSHTLATEARETNPSYPIIKRRIAWLISKWIISMCIPADSSIIWGVLVHLLQDRGPGTDAVVRLTAAVALKECVDSVEFNPNVFTPFLPSVVTELMRLIGEADAPESKKRIVNTLNVVIERAGSQIFPLAEMITKPLPQLWMSANEDWPFKSLLLATMTKLIASTKEQSAQLSVVVVSLIRESLSPGTMSHLDEDGLILWLTALRNTITIQGVNGAPALIDLFPLSLSLLSTNLDLLGKIIDILESYFILDGHYVLQSYAVDLFYAFLTALNSGAVGLNMKDMVIAINLLLQLTPPALWGGPMHISGLFSHSLNMLINGEVGTPLLTENLYVLARIMIADQQIFVQLMSATASSQNKPESVLYESLLDKWWETFDSMSEPRHRKLAAMGIASLVATGRPEVLRRLPDEIFNLWLDVFGEIKEVQTRAAGDEGSVAVNSPLSVKCYWEQDEPPLTYFRGTEGTPEYDRRKALYDRDPVRTTLLSEFVAARLREAEAACGGVEVLQNVYLAKADAVVLKQIQDELMHS